MVSKKRQVINFRTLIDLAVVSLIFACYNWIRYHRHPPLSDWAEAFTVWVILYAVRDGYHYVVEKLEQQNALLVRIATYLEEQGNAESQRG